MALLVQDGNPYHTPTVLASQGKSIRAENLYPRTLIIS